MGDDSLFGGLLGAVVALKVVDTVFPSRPVTRVVYVNQPRRKVAHRKVQYVRYVQRPSIWDIQNPYL